MKGDGGIGSATRKRFAEEDAKIAVQDLAPDDAAFVTGQASSVSGGLTMNG